MLGLAQPTPIGFVFATTWGIFAFLFAGLAVPVYFIRYFASRRRKG